MPIFLDIEDIFDAGKRRQVTKNLQYIFPKMVERIMGLESSSDTKPPMAGNEAEGERFLLVFGQLPIKAIIQIIHWSPNPLHIINVAARASTLVLISY